MSSPTDRTLSYVEALQEAVEQEMDRDEKVFVIGLNVDDHKAIQGTTRGLIDTFGPERVIDTPLSEDAVTGLCIGAAMAGMRPLHVHIRMDFLMLCMNQLVNMGAKAHYMYGGQVSVPMVSRSIIGKSWGQGAQHSQGLPDRRHPRQQPGPVRRTPPFIFHRRPGPERPLHRRFRQRPHCRRRHRHHPGRYFLYAGRVLGRA